MNDLLRGVGAVMAIVLIGKAAKTVVGGTGKVLRSTAKAVGAGRKPAVRRRKQRGVTVGQVVALPFLALTSVFFGSRKSWREKGWSKQEHWVEPGSTWRDPNDIYKF